MDVPVICVSGSKDVSGFYANRLGGLINCDDRPGFRTAGDDLVDMSLLEPGDVGVAHLGRRKGRHYGVRDRGHGPEYTPRGWAANSLFGRGNADEICNRGPGRLVRP